MILRAVVALVIVTGAATACATVQTMPGVENPARARQNWILKCQGCHRADATGTAATAPAMAGQISRFLSVPAGRDYLARVPGVATAALNDVELAELLNWSLLRFDPVHLPADFQPYTSAEVGKLRGSPLRTDAMEIRARIMVDLEKRSGPSTPGQEQVESLQR